MVGHSRFYEYPISYRRGRTLLPDGTVVTLATNNRYNNFSDQKVFLINTDSRADGTGAAQRVHDVYVKTKNVMSYSVEDVETGMVFASSDMPNIVRTVEGTSVSTIQNGFQHDLLALATDGNGVLSRQLRITFVGTNVEIYALMALRQLFTVDANGTYQRRDRRYANRTQQTRTNWYGDQNVSKQAGSRLKEITNYTIRWQNDNDIRQMIRLMNEHSNFSFIEEYERFPESAYPALFPELESQLRYASNWKLGSQLHSLTIAEK